MRRVTPEERELFLAALAGKQPLPPVSSKPAAHIGAAPAAPVPRTKAVPFPLSGRNASDDEILQFLEAIGLRTPAVVPVKTPAPKIPLKTPSKPPSKTATGLDGNTKRRLERGDIAPTAKLDLHGLTESAAHGTLTTFLIAAHRRGDRLVLVVTGKGTASESPHLLFEHGRGVLRQMVPRWLEEAPMARIVADKRWAHRRHGGDGALYIYLRKNARN
jgi:DNA-nicking Smr family endonuclease